MAIRQIRELGDSVLEKKCKPVKEMNDSLRQLIDDMFETMYEANGVGLAAPQVGILKRLVVIDCTGEDPFVFINPEIVEADGEQTGYEGCLSLPGKSGVVTRPNHVVVKALDENMDEFTLECEELMARAVCHELDHLDGHMYVEKVDGGINGLVDNSELNRESSEEEEEA
ncbi:peptide deformylase [Butyrivibrio sp. MC2013]|uniref:peptide deformylase n=1 Tax=Butyrivibrio sp. MC2013 TaxID=1280686 RepID=UPI000405C4AA|nr:peptide deformylase [Butyrivibrio sp. MC2013]